MIRDAGHMVMLEKPEETAGAVATFCKLDCLQGRCLPRLDATLIAPATAGVDAHRVPIHQATGRACGELARP